MNLLRVYLALVRQILELVGGLLAIAFLISVLVWLVGWMQP